MILMDDITRDGNPVLRKQAQALDFPLSEEDQQFAKDMMEYLYNSQDETLNKKYNLRAGVGLAAPQVDRSIQMFALLVPDIEAEAKAVQAGEDYEETIALEGVMCNPKIVSHSVEKICLRQGEGCLSVDEDVPGYVPRYSRITLEFDDLDGNHHKKRFKGYPAIVIQHELDHLLGHLYYDRISKADPWTLPDEHTFLLGDEY